MTDIGSGALPFFVGPSDGQVLGTAAPLMRDHVNTDVIIPATHMRRLTKTGYADVLFEPWRGTPGFVLDDPRYAAASVLLAGAAFGSGSSREHAPWALRDAGFRAIIAQSFADIFAQNCSIVGLVTVSLPRAPLEKLAALVVEHPDLVISIDVNTSEVTAGEFVHTFQIEAHIRARLLGGGDPIATTMQHGDAITAFENSRPRWMPSTRREARA